MRRVCALVALSIGSGLADPVAFAAPVTWDFDGPPPESWEVVASGGSQGIAGGTLTITAPSNYNELFLWGGQWKDGVSNARGWAVEPRVGGDPSSDATVPCDESRGGTVGFWIHDARSLSKVALTPTAVCITYPEHVVFSTPSTMSSASSESRARA